MERDSGKRFKCRKIFLPLFLLLLPCLLFGDGEDEWNLAKDYDKIKIYRRHVKGYNVDEFKAIGADAVRIDVIGVILEDIPSYQQWLSYVKESRIVKKIDENSMIIYQQFYVKWPLYERDCLMMVNSVKDYDNGKVTITMNAIDDNSVPLPERTIRITQLTGTIILEYVDREHTKGLYQVKMDFGGSTPVWLSNLISKYMPALTLNNLGKEAKKSDRINAASKSIYYEKIEEAIRNGKLKSQLPAK